MHDDVIGHPAREQGIQLADARHDMLGIERRNDFLNLGRNLTSEALKYGDVARNLYNQVGQQIDQAANSLMSTLGYYGARNDTFYPTTFLGSSGRNDGGFIVSASPGFSGATGALDATGA